MELLVTLPVLNKRNLKVQVTLNHKKPLTQATPTLVLHTQDMAEFMVNLDTLQALSLLLTQRKVVHFLRNLLAQDTTVAL